MTMFCGITIVGLLSKLIEYTKGGTPRSCAALCAWLLKQYSNFLLSTQHSITACLKRHDEEKMGDEEAK
jgi:hypothetical protein